MLALGCVLDAVLDHHGGCEGYSMKRGTGKTSRGSWSVLVPL